MKKVFKYATGDEIPEGAVYLSTKVEKHVIKSPHIDIRGNETGEWDIYEKNKLVWHYFLVETDIQAAVHKSLGNGPYGNINA